MNFKKVFSAIVAGLITSTLFSNLSFASENQSTQQSQSGPDRIVLIDKDTPKDEREKYGVSEYQNFDNERLYFLTDVSCNIYSYLHTNKSIDGGVFFKYLKTLKEYRKKGYAASLMVAVLNSYKNTNIYLEDGCGFDFYGKFGFRVEQGKEDDFPTPMVLQKGEEDVDYKGRQKSLELRIEHLK